MSACAPRRQREDSSSGIQVFVTGIGNGTITLHHVRADQQISSLRRRIQDKAQVDDNFQLYYGCKCLEDGRTLGDYQILNMTTLSAKFAFGWRPTAEEKVKKVPVHRDMKIAVPMGSQFIRNKRQRARVLTRPDMKIVVSPGSSLDRGKRRRCSRENVWSEGQPDQLVSDWEDFSAMRCATNTRRRKYADAVASGVEWVPGKKRATESTRRARILLVKRANAFTIQVRS
mmetsp:Transcript_15733/g.29872  ORF Transcript_15733/g.29872 Transcript_15733/m.29872 type:complete len:229 (-) Transcript_15733:278-964(-)